MMVVGVAVIAVVAVLMMRGVGEVGGDGISVYKT